MFSESDYKYKKRLKKYGGETSSTYLYGLPENFVIDSTRQGNLASFLNHSCDPNCIALNWEHEVVDRIFIFSLKNIPANKELTYDYREKFY